MTSREETHERRAEARKARRAKLSSSRGGDEEKQKATKGQRARPDAGRSPGKTAATVAAIGASVGAVTFAGKKLLSSRRRDTGSEAEESTETS